MIDVELVYDTDCPNAAEARDNVARALTETGLPLRWTEWERSSPDAPARAHGFGSTTVLVNGHDIAGMQGSGHPTCRIYNLADGRRGGVPPTGLIVDALLQAQARNIALAGANDHAGRIWK